MITRSELSVQTIEDFDSWQEQLANAVTSPEQLLAMLGLDQKLLPAAIKASEDFLLKVPQGFISRMEYGNANDPLLRQVLPIGEECLQVDGFGIDPLAEQGDNPVDGILHKYHGRLLLVVTGACAVNCRFCFRRHFPYSDNRLDRDAWSKTMDYIRSDSSVKEVILSGGDPLASSDKRLKKLAEELNAIPHVETLRIHSRLPVVIPERITSEMLEWFTQQRTKPVIVVHANHANEINSAVSDAMNRLREAGVTLLNQSALLRGVNDDVDTLVELSEALFKAGVLPYYLHAFDPVHGAAHFNVPDEQARALIKGVMTKCPGYLVPKLVREVPGEPGKTWIN